MADSWLVLEGSKAAAFTRGVASLDDALQPIGEQVSGGEDSTCRVFRREIGGDVFFIKNYQANEFQWRNFLGYSKVHTEWRNLLFFRSLGLHIPEPIAFGERRKGFVFKAGVLVSAEIPGAVDLAWLVEQRPELFANREWFASLCSALGEPLRRLHDTGFAHNDLNWRNVLLTLEPSLKVYFFDCPTGRRWPAPFRQFRIRKDLAHLDKMGRRHLSRSQRLRFYLGYSGRARLNSQDKALIRKVVGRTVDSKYNPGQNHP